MLVDKRAIQVQKRVVRIESIVVRGDFVIVDVVPRSSRDTFWKLPTRTLPARWRVTVVVRTRQAKTLGDLLVEVCAAERVMYLLEERWMTDKRWSPVLNLDR